MPGRLTIGARNMKIGTKYLRIGPLAGAGGYSASMFRQSATALFAVPGTVTITGRTVGQTYLVLGANISISGWGGENGTATMVHSFTQTWGVGTPTVIPVEIWAYRANATTVTFQQVPVVTSGGFSLSAWHDYIYTVTGSTPLLLSCRYIRPMTGTNLIHAQDSNLNWSPSLPATPYDEDEPFDIPQVLL